MDLVEEIKSIAESKLTDASQFIVDVKVSAKKGPKKVLIFLDSDGPISIDECAELSRQVSKTLDESALLGEESYLLEVSTPGVDHPLKFQRQYKKNIGRKLRVTVGEKTIEGKLTNVADNSITLEQEVGTGKKKDLKNIDVDFSQIEKAFVLVSFK